MEVRLANEQHIEVHKFHGGAVTAMVVLALMLEAFLPVHLRWMELVDFPLLVTIYFALSRRNPSSGLLLGMVIGVAQDSLSHTPIGLYGIAKTVVGFTAYCGPNSLRRGADAYLSSFEGLGLPELQTLWQGSDRLP